MEQEKRMTGAEENLQEEEQTTSSGQKDAREESREEMPISCGASTGGMCEKRKEGPDPFQFSTIRWEVLRAAEDGIDLRPYRNFTAPQLRQIRLCLRDEGECRYLLEHDYDYLQMELLRRGRKEGLNIARFSDPKFDAGQMWEIMEGLRARVDIARYAREEFSSEQMREIRLGLESGLETTCYEDPQIPAGKMRSLRRRAPKAKLWTRMRLALQILFAHPAMRRMDY